MDVESAFREHEGDAKRRIGVLGGTFDPIHNGHLVIAEEVRVRMGLERVLFVPARISPLKLARRTTPAHHRCRMIELAIAGNPFFALSRVDLDRPGPSYTVDTLRLLKTQLGDEAGIFFILGQDALSTILHWRAPAEIMRLAHLAVVSRPGYRADLSSLEAALPGLRDALTILESPELSVSSTDLRQRLRKGWPIRYQVPDAVMAYIQEHHLYRNEHDVERGHQAHSREDALAGHHHKLRRSSSHHV